MKEYKFKVTGLFLKGAMSLGMGKDGGFVANPVAASEKIGKVIAVRCDGGIRLPSWDRLGLCLWPKEVDISISPSPIEDLIGKEVTVVTSPYTIALDKYVKCGGTIDVSDEREAKLFIRSISLQYAPGNLIKAAYMGGIRHFVSGEYEIINMNAYRVVAGGKEVEFSQLDCQLAGEYTWDEIRVVSRMAQNKTN